MRPGQRWPGLIVSEQAMDRVRMDLYLLRHGDAGDAEEWTGPEEERPLTATGRRQSERLARHLAGLRFHVDVMLTSPKVRAAETAAIVADVIGINPRIDDRLAEGVELAVAEAILADQGRAASVMLVGHDPDFSDLLAELCGGAAVPLRKGALARVEVPRPLAAGAGRLRWLLPPDAVRNR
jgi:phosphohistidine phosphatase